MRLAKIISFVTLLLIIGCAKDINDSRCNYLLDLDIYYEVNLNLPQYNDLNFISNSVYIPNVGNGGIIIVNSGTGYLAWDAADANLTMLDAYYFWIRSNLWLCRAKHLQFNHGTINWSSPNLLAQTLQG